MDTNHAVRAISALAHVHRIEAFRILVQEGPSGLPAGEIAARLEINPSALSFHLAHLERSGLVHTWREGRNCIYAVEIGGVRQLLRFLTEDCCNGYPELCGGLAFAVDPSPADRGTADERQ